MTSERLETFMLRHAPVVVLLGGVAFGTGYVLNHFWPKPPATATAREYVANKPAEARPIPSPPPDLRPATLIDVPLPPVIDLEPKPPILPVAGQDAPKLDVPPPPAKNDGPPGVDVPPSPPIFVDPPSKPVPPPVAVPRPEVPIDLSPKLSAPEPMAVPKAEPFAPAIPMAEPPFITHPKPKVVPEEGPAVGAPPSPPRSPSRPGRITEDALPSAIPDSPPPVGEPKRIADPIPATPGANAPGSPQALAPVPPPDMTAQLKAVESVVSLPLPPLKFINTRDVAFKYEVTKQGTSGIQAVELWVTEDDGKTWEMFVRQEGDRSPIKARLRGEGVYGFRLVLVNGNGHRCGEPKPGEPPAMRAELDLTLPYVRIDAIERAKANDGVLDLRWTVADRNFNDRSCNPEWSEDGRDWKPVVADPKKDASSPKVNEHPKFGRSYAYGYGWKVPEKMPTKVWLRVRCKDLAGNESEYRWPAKVSADLVDPSAGLTSLDESRDGSMRRKDAATTPFPDVNELPGRRE